jgi:hypothetical protein
MAQRAVLTAILGLALVFIIAPIPPSARLVSDRFWQQFLVRGSQVEQYDNLMTMAAMADAVVIGRVVAAEPGRVYFDPEVAAIIGRENAEVRYMKLTVEPTEILRSQGGVDGQIVLEVMVANFDEAANVPTEDAIFFLRNKGNEVRALGFPPARVAEEAPYHRLVIASAVLRIFDSKVVPAVGTEEEFLLALDGVSVEHVRQQMASVGG